MRLGFFFYGGMVVSQIRVLGEFSPYRTLQHKKAYRGRPFLFPIHSCYLYSNCPMFKLFIGICINNPLLIIN